MSSTAATSSSRLAVLEIFDRYRADIDDNHDRRERLIKAGRDITNLSKKTIFLLQRCAIEEPSRNEDERAKNKRAAQRGYEKLRQIQDIYAKLRHELQGDKFWRYQRHISPGLQEYIEALSFAYYLDHESLITFDVVQRTLMDSEGHEFFPLTPEDYLLGLSDLTGELMRFAISGITRRGGRTKAMEVCAFVRDCKADFEHFTPYSSDLRRKQSVTTQSLEKIENATYAIVVRNSEYELSPEMLDDIIELSISRFKDRQERYDSNGEQVF